MVVASEKRETAANLRALSAGGADMTEAGIDGNTALHIAAYYDGELADIQFLLEVGISPDIRNELGQTALIFAAEQSANPDVVRLLVRLTEDPCASDEAGTTASFALANNEALANDQGLRRLFHESCVEAE